MNKLFTLAGLLAIMTVLINCTPKAKPTTSARSTSSASSTSSRATLSDNKEATSNKQPSEVEEKLTSSFSDMSYEEKLASLPSLADNQITEGMTLYQTKCGKCHKLHQPTSRDIGGWLKIMKPMSKKAKLSDLEYQEILGYLNINCAK